MSCACDLQTQTFGSWDKRRGSVSPAPSQVALWHKEKQTHWTGGTSARSPSVAFLLCQFFSSKLIFKQNQLKCKKGLIFKDESFLLQLKVGASWHSVVYLPGKPSKLYPGGFASEPVCLLLRSALAFSLLTSVASYCRIDVDYVWFVYFPAVL